MATATLDGSGAGGFTVSDGINYGCAGRGIYDPFSSTKGHQVDTADTAFYVWKKCVQCATESTDVQSYDYDQANDSCGNYEIYLKEINYDLQRILPISAAGSVNVIALLSMHFTMRFQQTPTTTLTPVNKVS